MCALQQIEFELDAPPYLAEVAGTITRVDANGVTLEFPWQAAMLTGSISKEELKVPFAALPAARQAALTNEWAETGYLPPAYVAMDDDEFDAAAYYKVGEKLAAFVLDSDMDGAGLALTHFTDEEIAGDAVDAFEGIEDDEELLDMLADGAEADEALAVTPEDLMEEEADVAKAAAASLSEHAAEDAAAYGFATRASLLRNKDGQMVSPMGLPSRPTVSRAHGHMHSCTPPAHPAGHINTLQQVVLLAAWSWPVWRSGLDLICRMCMAMHAKHASTGWACLSAHAYERLRLHKLWGIWLFGLHACTEHGDARPPLTPPCVHAHVAPCRTPLTPPP